MTTHGLRRLVAVGLLLPAIAQAAEPGPASPAGTPPTPSPTATRAAPVTQPAAPVVKETVTVNSAGKGRTRDEAIASALSLAVIQVQGKELPFDMLSRMFMKSVREERMIRMNVMNDSRIRATRISTAVAFVQDYQVTESTRDEDSGDWQARVSAEVVSPQAQLAKRRETVQLSLLPFVVMQEEESEAGTPATQAAMKQTQADLASFRQRLQGLLQQPGRVTFHVLPPALEGQYASAADTPGNLDWNALRSRTGANHFVTVQVEDFRLEPVKLKGNITTPRLDGGFTLHYRLIRDEGGPPEIIKSGTFTIDTRSPWLRPLAMSESSRQATPEEIRKRMGAIHARVAQLFASTILSDIVLPQVMAREGDTLLLQRGASQLRAGDQLAVLGPDVTETDTGTGLLQRTDGMRIAVIEVTDTTPERVTARVVKGNVFAVQPGSLLRRIGAGSSGIAAAAIPEEKAPVAGSKR